MRPHVLISLLVVALTSGNLLAQTPTGVEGQWLATLTAGANHLRLVLDVSRASDGLLLGTLTSVDQGVRIPIDKIEQTGNSVHLELKSVRGTFDGILSADQTTLSGIWTQGSPLALEFTRVAPGAAASTLPGAVASAPTSAITLPGVPVEMTVPVAPIPFLGGGGKTHLVYELHVTNFAPVAELLSKIEVLSGTTILAAYEGTELNSILARPGVPNAADRRAVGPGQRAIAYLWITLEAGTPVPTSLRHRITSRVQTVEGDAVAVRAGPPLVLGPPLRGEDWVAANGPANASPHRRALILLNGSAHIAQRFAIDWVQIGPNGRTFDGDKEDNKAYRAYGSEVLAVADGTVAFVTDGIPENVPGPTSRAVPITPETIAGNSVLLDLGGGHFAFYAHLQPSLRVKVGDTVRRGQPLGLVGNSGNSPEPHLHFHVTDGPVALESEGVPYVLESFEIHSAPNTWEPRQHQLPLLNERVRFPAVK